MPLVQVDWLYATLDKITIFAVYFYTMKRIIESKSAPAPIGPYSQAVLAGNTLYVSGQIPIDPVTQQYIPADIETETRRVLSNIQAILSEAKMEFQHIVKTSIFLADMNDFSVVNSIYATYFSKDFPARETIQVSVLPKNARIEISVIAVNTAT